MKHLTITGRITKDVALEKRTIGERTDSVVNFNVAVNTPTKRRNPDGSYVTDANGYREQIPEYYKVTLWREQAEKLAPSLKKGRKVLVAGKNIAMEQWTGRDNVIHPTMHFTNPDIEFLDNKPVETTGEPDDDNAIEEAPVAAEELPFEM